MKMKKLLLICYAVLALAFVLPFFLREPEQKTVAQQPVFTAPDSTSGAEADEADRAHNEEWYSVRVKCGDDCIEMDMTEYLIGVVAAEMPASFDEDALRAQAVAARTYTMYCAAQGRHNDAQVCASAGCCQAWLDDAALHERLGEGYDVYREKIRRAVTDTAGEYLSYGGAPVFAAFHSSSAGATEDSGNVWNAVPYLVSVDSPEDASTVPDYVSTVEVSAPDFRDSVLRLRPEADMTGEPATWVGAAQKNESGRVDSVLIGGQSVTGGELRQTFLLRSTAFTLEYTGEVFRFTVTGFGHGVGMSQYGANVMAQNGADYKEILAHYYPETELVRG